MLLKTVILLNPQSEINKIFKFLNLTKLNNIKMKEKQLDVYGNIWNNNSSFDKTKNPKTFNKKLSIDRWRKNLNNQEILITEMICSDYMKYFGYKPKYNTIYANILKNSIKLLMKNNEITKYLKINLEKGKGIQKFPTNPLVQKNWSKN